MLEEYKAAIDKALESVQDAKSIFEYKYSDWDRQWYLDKFDHALDFLDEARGFFDVAED